MIPPALTKEEFDILRADDLGHEGVAAWLSSSWSNDEQSANEAAKIIAAMNDRLPDTDPRKITYLQVDLLYAVIARLEEQRIGENPFDTRVAQIALLQLTHLADALASYLPPRA